MTSIVMDYSHWESYVNFASIKDQGCVAVMLKATQGASWVDPTFVSRVSLCNSVGLLVGAYHFCDGTDPTMQVAHFLRVASLACKVLALDVEENGSSGGTVSITQAAQMASLIYSATTRLPLIYINRYGPTGNGAGLPNSVLGRCPLWIPEYTNRRTPTLPAGWSTWSMWQWTDTPTDENHFNGDAAALRMLWNG